MVAKISRADTSTDPAPRQHDRDDHQPEAGVPVAARDDAGAADRRAGRRHHHARRVEHLDPADHQPDQHADDRHPVRGRREGLRQRPEGARGAGPRGGRGAAEDPGRRRRVPGAGDRRPLPRHPGEPGGGGALRHHGGRRPGRDRDRGRGDQPDADHRGPAAVPGARALRAAVPRQRAGARAASSSRRPTARRCRSASSPRSARSPGPP